MKTIMLIAAAALALAGCGDKVPLSSAGTIASGAAAVADSTGVPPPASIADKTTADETTGLGLESVITLGATAAKLAVQTGVVKGTANLERLRGLNAKLREGVRLAREAYAVTNASDYKSAMAMINSALADINAMTKGTAK